MSFIHDDFLLHSDLARELFHETAADLPIIDYHCHLPPEDVASNRHFKDLFEIWLEGDHYKWRAMRTNGVAERYCTGDATPEEKFMAYAETVPETLRNPLYHWSHLELKRYFGIDTLLSPKTAGAIWAEANEKLATDDALTAHGILEKFKVSVVCTTDDPADSLDHHTSIAASGIGTRIYPTFRPDKALTVNAPEAFNAWTDKLEGTADVDCSNFAGFLDAIKQRHDAFHRIGGRLSDHGLEACYADFPTEAEAKAIFDKARAGTAATPEEHTRFASFMMLYFGHLDAEKGWTKQLHLGAMRNNNKRLFEALGPDTGFDSIGDFPQGRSLSAYLSQLDSDNRLPKVVLYNLNPSDNYLFATMIGNFQDGSIAGKVQFGSGWWFLDQKEGMTMQMNALSNLGLLSRFVGMLTDSRSFLSYPRHEYFRRILCNLIAVDVLNGEIPDDRELVQGLIHKVCYGNAAKFFGFELGAYTA